MSNVQIPNLPAATGLNGSEQFEGVQSGTSVRISASQIATYINAAYPAPGIASVSGSAPIAVSTVGSAATVSLDLQGITNAYMAPMAAGTVKANVAVGSASPTDATVSQILDTIGSTKGMMLYRDTTSWVALTAGTAGQVLTAQGTTAAPIWSSLSISPGSLVPTGVVAGTYGSASTVPQYTVLASGQLSAASNVPIVIPSTSVTGLGSMATQNANTVAITGGNINATPIGSSTPSTGAFTSLSASGSASLATISSGTWNGTPIAVLYGGTGATTASGARANLGAASSGANSDITSLSGLTTPLSATQGGSGFGSYTTGDILYADTSSTLARLNDVATGNALISGGNGVAPLWGKIGLTTHVSGTLPVANGGSGATTLTGFLKGNGTSAFTAQATIGNADLTNSSITVGSTSIALGGTATTLGGLTTVTLTQDPTAALQAATKQYVDAQVATAGAGSTIHTASAYATTADLGSVTYSNGTGGVNATITQSGSPSVLIIDGYTFTASDVTNATRVLVKDQSSGLQNGIYTVANQGSGAANWQLIRATDFNTVGTGPNFVQTGAFTFVTSGSANTSTSWQMTTTGTITIGSTALVWSQTAASGTVTVTSPLVKVGTVISLGTVPTTLGGTGLTTLTQYGVMLGNGTGNVAFASPGTSGLPLLSTGASSNPAFGQLSLTAGVTGTLPVTNGGTGTSTAFTAGSVVFAGASGTYSQSNSELFWNNSSNFLGIGTGSPDAVLTVVSPTQTSVTAGTLPAGTDLHIVGADGAITRITQDAFGTGNYAAYTGRAARGTAASPTASQAGDVLSQYGGRGHGVTSYSSNSVGRIDIEAAENFTDTAQGSYISLHTTATGTATPNERFRAGPAGQWGIGGANYGTSGQVFTSGGASAAPTWSDISVTTVTGTLPVANGGTGLTSYTIGDLIYASGATTLAKLADVATGNALISGGVGVAPSWGKIGLTTHVSGTLPIANGGTGVTGTPVNGELLIGNGTGYSLATLTASTGVSVTNGSGTITIANTGVTSLTAGTAISVSASTGGVTVTNTGVTSAVASTGISVSGATGAVTFSNTGVTSAVAGTGISVSSATGAVTFSNNGVTGLTAGTNISLSGSTGGVTVSTVNNPVFSTSVTSPLVIGGTTTSSTLTLQSTSGAGATDSILFKVGNNGATTAMSIATGGTVTIGGIAAIGTLTLTNALTPANGGTGLTSYTAGDLLYASGTTTISTLADVAVGSVLVSGGVGGNPSYSANPTVTSIIVGAGTVSAPSITPTDDTNTGIFYPAADTVAVTTGGSERVRVASAGQIGIAGANYGTAGQVLTSGGASAAPSWATPTIDLTGSIISYASASAPSGYLACDGSTYLKSAYTALSTVIGQVPTLQPSYNSNLVVASPVHYVNGNLISGTKFSSNGGGSWSNIGTNNIASANAPSGNWIWTGTYYVNGAGYAGTAGIRHRTTLAGAGTAVTTNINYAVYGLAWNGSNLAIAGGIGLATISYSANGIAWTTGATLGTGGNCNDVAFGNGVFVIAGRNTASGPSIWTTTNGTAVTLQTLPSGFTSGATRIYTVTYANSLFIAVNDIGAVASSPDGVTWTLKAAAYSVAPSWIAAASQTATTASAPYLFTGPPVGEYSYPISRTMYCNGLYFNGSYYSSDLITWKLIPPFQIGNSPSSLAEQSGWCGTDGTTMFYSGYSYQFSGACSAAIGTLPSSFNPFNYTTSTQFVVPNMTGLQAPNQYYYIKT